MEKKKKKLKFTYAVSVCSNTKTFVMASLHLNL